MRLPNLAQQKRADELYRSVVEPAPDSIITVDMKGMTTSSKYRCDNNPRLFQR